MSDDIFQQAKKNLKYIISDEELAGNTLSKDILKVFFEGTDEGDDRMIATMLCGSLLVQGYSFESIRNRGDDLSLGNLIKELLEEMSNEAN